MESVSLNIDSILVLLHIKLLMSISEVLALSYAMASLFILNFGSSNSLILLGRLIGRALSRRP
jgi:hypothetical protein